VNATIAAAGAPADLSLGALAAEDAAGFRRPASAHLKFRVAKDRPRRQVGATMGLIPSPTILSTDEMGRIAPPIFTSVGRDGINAPGDVFVVQSLLNDRLPKPHTPIPVTGVVDVGTALAIENYQAAMMGMTSPSGRVDPGSPTYYSLAAHPLIDEKALAGVAHYGELPPPVIEAAVASNQHWKVPAAVTLAQWAVESAWGAAMPPNSNNPFGIKAVADQPAVETQTQEVVNGETVTISARFRMFDSIAQAFDEHGRLLATSSHYTAAMQQAQNPEAFADALTGVYATDPEYGLKLKWVMQNYKLEMYDR
jgi:hypothetical protein